MIWVWMPITRPICWGILFPEVRVSLGQSISRRPPKAGRLSANAWDPKVVRGEGPGGEGPEGKRPAVKDQTVKDRVAVKILVVNRKGAPPGMGGTSVGGSSAGMAIHKAEGLVPINDKCESNIPGLYAAGDALGSYMAGGIYTQIGSSLAGSAVQGAIAAEAAAAYCEGI